MMYEKNKRDEYYHARKKTDKGRLPVCIYRNLMHVIRRVKAGYMTGQEAADYIWVVKRLRPEIYRGFIRTLRM